MQHNGWDHALKVTADGKGLVGHAGAILLRKAADQLGLTAALSAALQRKSTAPLLDRPARSEPVRTRAHRAHRPPPTTKANGHEVKKQTQAQSVTRPQAA